MRLTGNSITAALWALLSILGILAPPAVAYADSEEAAASLGELLLQGSERLEDGEPAAAVEALGRAVEIAPDSGKAHALLGRALALGDRHLAAEAALRRAVELGWSDLATWFYLGSTLWENGRLAEAEQTFHLAIERLGRSRLLVHQLGRLLSWQGRGAEAAPLLREVAEMTPAGADVLLDLARALHAAGDLQGARDAYSQTIELAPDDSHARYGLATVLGRLGEAEAAERELAAYRRLYQEDQERLRQEGLAEARIAQGYELLRAGRLDEAIPHLRALPETAASQAALATAYQAAGNNDDALSALERAVALAPDRGDLRTLLNDARLRQQDSQ